MLVFVEISKPINNCKKLLFWELLIGIVRDFDEEREILLVSFLNI